VKPHRNNGRGTPATYPSEDHEIRSSGGKIPRRGVKEHETTVFAWSRAGKHTHSPDAKTAKKWYVKYLSTVFIFELEVTSNKKFV
jgi:hypothetical protein